MPVRLSPAGRAIAAGVALAGLLLGAFALGAGRVGGAPAAAAPGQVSLTAAAPVTGAARITVTGSGTVTGTPGQLALSMGVQTTAPSVAAALQQANQAVRAVTGVLARSGVRPSDIQTSGLSIEPQYGSGSPVPSGYGVSESIQVTLRRLASAGSQISAAVRAGGNATVIDGVSLNLSDTSSLLAAARAKAIADARTKAAQYARALGRPLGPVVSMSELAAPQPLPVVPYAASAAGRAAAVPVHPGSQQLSVTITAVFALS